MSRGLRRLPGAGPGLLGIIGRPVRTSLSPRMQEAALRRLGLDARYLAFEIDPHEVRPVLRALAPLGFWGINVTIPYKEAVARLVDDIDPRAAAIGAVNTVVVRGGRLVGHNTDAEGFRRAAVEGGARLRGSRVLIAGAGGAARAVAYACLAAGCASVAVAARTPTRARALCRALHPRFPRAELTAVADREPGLARLAAGCGVLVNTTPLGSRPADPLPLPAEALRAGQVVVDIVYRPRRTALLETAGVAGARTVDGLGMLLHQGALAFELWTGRAAPLPTMRRALAVAAADAARRA